jgi:putative integral membrane protein (TIGR02587 family)
MAEAAAENAARRSDDRGYAIGLARAFAGALIFAFPLIMTMEMWWIGFYVEPVRLLIFLLLGLGLQTGLAYYSGFSPSRDVTDALIGGVTAFAIGCLGSAAVLWLLGVLDTAQGWRGAVGMVAIQAVPAGIGAVAARQQLGGTREGQAREDRAGYPAQLFLMAAGAVFLAFNVAPTEEMILITFRMGPWLILLLMAASVLLLHALVYTVGFAGQEQPADGGFAAHRGRCRPGSAAGHAVRLVVRNEGTRTAAAVEVEGRLFDGEELLESSRVTLDYVPRGSATRAGLWFARDPNGLRLEVRALGYQEP